MAHYTYCEHGKEICYECREKHIQQGWNATMKRAVEVAPEEGIKWMQEGSNNDMKGFTDGFNPCRQMYIEAIEKEMKK